MGQIKVADDAAIRQMSDEAMGRMMADVNAFDQAVLDELQKRHTYEKALKLMRDVAELVQLGYPKLEAIVTAEENRIIYHGI
jgi:D-arabinose 1-dehydrogenase-like Zn-dependent alcohol dehydrogenase